MNKKQLLASLEGQDSSTLIKFLEAAYDQMNTDQRRAVFGKAVKKAKPPAVDGKSLLEDVKQFQRDSLAGAYLRSIRRQLKELQPHSRGDERLV